MSTMNAVIAANRFGIGARPGDLETVSKNPEAWLQAQISLKTPGSPTSPSMRTSAETATHLLELRDKKRQTEKALKLVPIMRKVYVDEVLARLRFAVLTPHGFHERLVRFWSNHFAVSAKKLVTLGLVGAYEREAIRPHVTGKLEDMLLAVIRHPAMLLYLDNINSIGPNSKRGNRAKKGINENLAREVMELHTLGINGGYAQSDVEELAKALTGWSVNGFRILKGKRGEFYFYKQLHEPGSRIVLGKSYSQNGERQAEVILRDLAQHPSTARFIATKLARHFIADIPPPGAIKKLERAYLESGGKLQAVYKTLIALDEAWEPQRVKLKTPEEFIVSTFRTLTREMPNLKGLQKTYETLGQPPFQYLAPDGWSDMAADWSGSDAIKKRVEWANEVAGLTGNIDPQGVLTHGLGGMVSAKTRQAVLRAESRAQGLVLALMSPEFQRR